MKRLFLVPVLAAAVVGLAPSAHAQSIWSGTSRAEYGDRQSYTDARRAAYDNGLREGTKQGEKDGRKGSVFAYQDERTFQRADKGYSRDFGDIERYRQSFRSGYAAGYSETYQRYSPAYRNGGNNGRYENSYPQGNGRYDARPGYGYPSQPGDYSPAYDNGVSDGYEKGAEDARKNRAYDVLGHEWYRAGDRRYEGRDGSKDQYKNVYREGFKEGYAQGYREGRSRF